METAIKDSMRSYIRKVGELQTRVKTYEYLIQRMLSLHTSSQYCHYEDCTVAPCNWCREAKEIMDQTDHGENINKNI